MVDYDKPYKKEDRIRNCIICGSLFGEVRCIHSNGLKRKFDADEYVEPVESL